MTDSAVQNPVSNKVDWCFILQDAIFIYFQEMSQQRSDLSWEVVE